MKTIDTLNPRIFRKICMSVGELPTSYMESMTYYEMVAWLCDYIKNNVVTTLNNHAEAIKEIQDWIENLDLQDEVDNKIDRMKESGELAEIITQYLEIHGILAFDSVADMKSAGNLVDGSFVETYGFYAKGDGGGAKYKVRGLTNQDVVDEMFLIALNEQDLVAELIIVNNTINILQLGAKADGETDNTARFVTIFSNYTNYQYLFPNTGSSYYCQYMPCKTGAKIKGINNPEIEIHHASPLTVVSHIQSNTVIDGLKFSCKDEDLEWSRVECKNSENVKIYNCTFEGFRHDSATPNAWGLILNNVRKFEIKNCYFSNNTQSDLAIENDNEDGVIEKCYGSNLNINFEPSSTNTGNKNIRVYDCNISKLSCFSYSNNIWDFENIDIVNCPITNLNYRGGNFNFVNSPVAALTSFSTSYTHSGIITNINSISLGKNLNDDPNILNVYPRNTETTKWIGGYSGTSGAVQAYKDNVHGRYVVFNPNKNDVIYSANRTFNISDGKKYILQMKTQTSTSSQIVSTSGLGVTIAWYVNGAFQSDINLHMDRNNTPNSTSSWSEKTIVLCPPTGATKLKLSVGNTRLDITSTQSVAYSDIKLSEFLPYSASVEYDAKSYCVTPSTAQVSQVGSGNFNIIGDKIYCEDTSQECEGYVCTALGTGQRNTWKKFGTFSNL